MLKTVDGKPLSLPSAVKKTEIKQKYSRKDAGVQIPDVSMNVAVKMNRGTVFLKKGKPLTDVKGFL